MFSVPGITEGTALTVSVSGWARNRSYSTSGALLQDVTYTLMPTMELFCNGGTAYNGGGLPLYTSYVNFNPRTGGIQDSGWLRTPHPPGRAMQISGGAIAAIGALGGLQWTMNSRFFIPPTTMTELEPSLVHPSGGSAFASVTATAKSIVSSATTKFANGAVMIDEYQFAINAAVLRCPETMAMGAGGCGCKGKGKAPGATAT